MPTGAARSYVSSPQSDLGVVITSPAENGLINSTSIHVVWAFNATQDQFRLQFYSDADGENIVYDTQWQTSVAQSSTTGIAGLTSNRLYYVKVFVHGTSGETGESAIRAFLFALPTSVNIAGLAAGPLPVCNPTPFDNPSIRVIWTRPVPTETFLCYEVRRRKRGETTYVAVARIFTIATPWYLDASVQPGQEYEYVVVFYGDSGTPDTLLSAQQATPARATVRFDFIYIHEVGAPQTEYFRVDSQAGSIEPKLDIALAVTWGRQRPSAFVGEAFAYSLTLPGLDKLRKNPRQWSKFIRMFERQSTQTTTLCVRYGLDQSIYFVNMLKVSKTLAQKSWAESVDLAEVHYSEDIGFYVHTAGDPP